MGASTWHKFETIFSKILTEMFEVYKLKFFIVARVSNFTGFVNLWHKLLLHGSWNNTRCFLWSGKKPSTPVTVIVFDDAHEITSLLCMKSHKSDTINFIHPYLRTCNYSSINMKHIKWVIKLCSLCVLSMFWL